MDGKLLVSRDAGLTGPMVVGSDAVAALTAVAEMLPKLSVIEVISPDKIVDGLSADADFRVVHYDLVGTQTFLKFIDEESGETAFSFHP